MPAARFALSCAFALSPMLCRAIELPPLLRRFAGQCPARCSVAECGNPHFSDVTKPIKQVLDERPNVNGFCYFAQLGAFWLQGVPATLKNRDMSEQLAEARAQDNAPVGKLITLSYEEVSLTTHDMVVYDGSRYDVPYCHGLGWFRGQLDTPPVDDFDAWEALSKQECKKLQELQDYTRGQMTLDYHLENRELHVSDFRAHVYVKCLMGSVSTEIMHCNLGMGCLLKGNYIGHGSECE
mmetsp:Transcript_47802/g.110764  ORF Transcript_47802/g.110764 Transcript_47802/m.110764 type:complete len:238 (+) Transcript_47802:91-804(+)